MLKRHPVAFLIFGLFILIDLFAWWITINLVNLPSPEQLEIEAAAPPTPTSSEVQQSRDQFFQRMSLNGEWFYRQTGREINEEYISAQNLDNWRTMDIPQNWYLAGLNYHGVIWFRRSFEIEPTWRGRAIQLEFGGVDYFTDVWLNGVKLGHHEGYFEPFSFDVTNLVRFDGPNILAVRVESPYEEYQTVWPRQKTLIKGIFGQSNTHPGGGWYQAGQDYNTGGIWNEVTLVASDFLVIEDVQVQATWSEPITTTNSPVVTASAILRNYSNDSVQATVSLEFTPRKFSGDSYSLPSETVTLDRGQTIVELNGIVKNPLLWWTWDRGEPNLYKVSMTVSSDDLVLAEKEILFGFRQVTLGEDWIWTLNGQRFFPRGTNYISSQWLSQVDENWLQRDVELMREANLNFVRVYSHIEPEVFYTDMDRTGLLVWQDLPLQWGYSDAPLFVDEAQSQLQAMIRLLFNHPSIAVWNMHNESPWASEWMEQQVSNYDPRQNKRLDEVLFSLAKEIDPTRIVHLNSGTGDAHVYPGWAEGQWQDYESLPGAPFITEYGAQALPNLEMMQEMFIPEELTYAFGDVRERWEHHDFQPNFTFDVAQIDPGDSPATFIINSQDYQANLLKYATENYRRSKYDPITGIFQFMFVDNWPSINWSVLDFARNPKSGFQALQTAMQPILPSINAPLPESLNGQRWIYPPATNLVVQIWAINDTQVDYTDAQLVWILSSKDGIIADRTITIHIHPDSSQQKTVLHDLPIEPGIYLLNVELLDSSGNLLGVNHFEFEIRAE